jgi:hypothetical protein
MPQFDSANQRRIARLNKVKTATEFHRMKYFTHQKDEVLKHLTVLHKTQKTTNSFRMEIFQWKNKKSPIKSA